MMNRLARSRSEVFMATLLSAGLCGCDSPPKKPQSISVPAVSRSGERLINPVKHPPGVTGTVAVRAEILPLGVVPYDNLSLPIVSPDGRFIASQSGIAPTWPTMIAATDSSVPELTRIEIYRLDWRTNIKEGELRMPVLQSTLNEPAMLGRSCDSTGFLIESPRSDGSRWIGKVAWNTGEVTWLIKDGNVNAFACLGPDGRLAWSRRTSDGQHFELCVRTPSGQWTMESSGDEWLVPQWSGRGDVLFCMQLQDGKLRAIYGNASSVMAFKQSIQRFTIASDATVSTAFQTLNGQYTIADAPAPPRDQLIYYHPQQNMLRMAFWRPLAEPSRKAMFLNPQSFAAILDEDDLGLIATDKNLVRQRLSSYSQHINLVAGLMIPRPMSTPEYPYMLLSPAEGQIGLMAMKLLPVVEPSAAPSK
jgi:hypothetical protein